ncbi:WxL domain-containing protein [Companilactobacillus jidongensis]|uniref:WxL domain-containing protein n=1 Tax=Companilactobacillus jidongensis TaxID=2486006 RepID=UPI000F767FB1|nr:WxL domain-containing protein [Companilactobacillus jidongensis]
MKKLIKGTAVLGAIALGVGSTLVTVAAATTDTTTTTTPTTSYTAPGTVPAAASPAPQTTTSDATLTTTQMLSLDDVPTISFGSQLYSVSKQNYTPLKLSSDLKLTNPGFSTGWSLDVSATPFSGTTSGTSLKGAALTIATPTDTPITADDSSNVSTLPTYKNGVTLSTSAVNLEDAAAGTGVGAYTTSYALADFSLYVPAGNLQGAYTSTVTWSLSDAPS